jgi:hypothetical protein
LSDPELAVQAQFRAIGGSAPAAANVFLVFSIKRKMDNANQITKTYQGLSSKDRALKNHSWQMYWYF